MRVKVKCESCEDEVCSKLFVVFWVHDGFTLFLVL